MAGESAQRARELESTPPPKTVHPGDSVRILTLDQKATVLSGPDSRGEVCVQAGIMKLNVKLKDIRLVEEKVKIQARAVAKLDKEREANMSIDVRGMTVDEAMLEIDRYLDSAFINGIHEVWVIHGKGTGALRAGIHGYLKRNSHVKSFRLGRYGEGEAGVTVVTLK